MYKQLLNRRQFGSWLTLGSSLAAVGPIVMAPSTALARTESAMVKLPDGTIVPALGQGSADLAQ